MGVDLTGVALAPDDAAVAVLSAPSPFVAFWTAFRENKGAIFGLALLAIVVAMALLAGFIAPHSPIDRKSVV